MVSEKANSFAPGVNQEPQFSLNVLKELCSKSFIWVLGQVFLLPVSMCYELKVFGSEHVDSCDGSNDVIY